MRERWRIDVSLCRFQLLPVDASCMTSMLPQQACHYGLVCITHTHTIIIIQIITYNMLCCLCLRVYDGREHFRIRTFDAMLVDTNMLYNHVFVNN